MKPRALVAMTAVGALVSVAGCAGPPSSREMQAWDAELKSLRVEQDSLRLRASELVAKDPQIQSLPQGDAVIRVPTTFVRDVLQKVVTEVASSVTLQLSGIKAHVGPKTVKKVVTIGKFTVDVDILEIVGKLRPQKPEVTFTGNRISLSLPVRVSEGYGKASIHFVWDGKNVAGAACGDMDVTQQVSGNVIPAQYVISGTLQLAIQGNHVVATPRFPEQKVRIRVTPSKKSWAAVDSLLGEKGGPCGWVLGKVDIPHILKGVVQEKGFNVKLPPGKIRPFVIPAGVTDSVTVGGRVVSVETSSDLIRIDPDAILYSAKVVLK